MSDVFISYAREDLERVRPLVQALTQVGWSVWWDRSIRAGKTWDSLIEEAIAGVRCVIVVWTKTSVNSEWVRVEADEGRDRGILVPVMLDDVKLPLAFRRMQAASLIGWSGATEDLLFQQLREAIADVIGLARRPTAESAAGESVFGALDCFSPTGRSRTTNRAFGRASVRTAGIPIAAIQSIAYGPAT